MSDEPRYGGAYVPKELPEPTDPRETIESACEARCTAPKAKLDACAARIEQKGSGDCAAWFGDYVHCVDECVAHSLFQKLK